MAKMRNPAAPHSRYGANRGSMGARNPILDLPATGCTLPVPDMPAGREWTDHERARWTELWESPQANAWDESCRGTVAAVVIYESQVFAGTASAWTAMELRHASEALGLTPRALAQLGWRIVEDES